MEDESETFDGDDGRVAFSHFTVREYLEGCSTTLHAFHLTKAEAHRFIVNSSLSYLRYYDSVYSLEERPDSALDTMNREHPVVTLYI